MREAAKWLGPRRMLAGVWEGSIVEEARPTRVSSSTTAAFPPAAQKREPLERPAPTSKPSPLTFMIPIRRGASGFVRWRLRKVGIGCGRLRTRERNRLALLGFLHTGRWQVVSGFPFCGPPQRPERDDRKYLLFASDYDGQFGPYVDVFADVLALRLNTLWWLCESYPGASRSGPLKRYIQHWEVRTEHYYSAYPNAPAKTIDNALALWRAWQAFDAEWGSSSPEEFETAFRQFVRDNQARF